MRKLGFLPILYMLCIGCAPKTEDASLSWQITFVPLGAELHFTDEAPIKRVSVFTPDGVLLAQLDFPITPRQIETVYFAWQEGETYRFEAISHAEQISEKTVTAPRTYPRGSLEIAIPYGTSGEDVAKRDQKMLVLRDSEMTATVIVKNGKVPTNFDLKLCIPATYTITRVPADWKIETVDNQKCLSTSDTFHVASEVWFHELGLKTSDTAIDTQKITGSIRFTTLDGETWEQKTTVQIRITAVSEIADKIYVASIDMPTDASGIVDLRQRSDTIYHPRPLFSWLGTERIDPYVPISYQTIRLQNRGEETIHVVVSSINRDMNSGEVVSFLAPPDAINAGTDRSISLTSLPAGEVTSISLPIYFHPQFAETGAYERNIAVKVWGSDSTVLNEKRPLHIVVPNRQALYVSGLAVLASFVGLVVLLRFHRQFFARFTTKQLIVIALFGTTVFVTVVVPSTLFLNLIRAVLGPLSVLVTGLVNETLYYALLTALLIYIGGEPNKKTGKHDTSHIYNQGGVILLVSAVRLLLGGVTFGLFTPMTIIFTGTSVLLLEGGFFLVHRRGLLMWGVVLGICDAIAVYVDFQLSILFYRLFYADWYIWLRIIVEGFAYTFFGVLLGAKLGRGLWRVAD